MTGEVTVGQGVARVQVRRWPAAEQLFRSDPRWVGGDDAYSVGLGGDRRLWLFGDSFIDPTAGGDRRGASLVDNTVAVQEGADPSSATMTFHWGTGADGDPGAFFTDPDPEVYLWPGDGALVDGRLVLFFMRIRPVRGSSPWWRVFESLANFEVVGWSAASIERPDLDPDDWEPRWLRRSSAPFATLVGSGGVFVSGGHVHAHAVPAAEERWWRSAGHLLARWPQRALVDGDLSRAEWWAGTADGWMLEDDLQDVPEAVAGPTLTEFTVHHDEAAERYVRTELVGFVFPRLRVRYASAPQGPWTRPRTLFRPAQAELGRVFCYAGKAHTGVEGADVLVTYNSNARNLETVRRRPDLYRPHCLAVTGIGRTAGTTNLLS